MNNQLGNDEDRKCNEESDMHFNAVKEGKATEASSRGAEHREEQQRRPCDCRNNEQPAIQEFQFIADKMRPPKELEDRATQYQGEIERFLAEIRFCHGVRALPRGRIGTQIFVNRHLQIEVHGVASERFTQR